MSAVEGGELLSSLLVFAGHSQTLYLMSLRKHSFRASVWLWIGVFLLSAGVALIVRLCIPSLPMLLEHSVVLGICAVAFLLSSQGNFLRNLFLFASYVNFLLYSFAVAQALAVRFFDNSFLVVVEFRLMLLEIFCVILVCDIRPAFLRVAQNLHRGWGSLTVLVCIFSGCLLVMAFVSNLFREVDRQTVAALVMLLTIMASAYIVIFKTIGALSEENRKRQLEIEKKLLTGQLTSYEQMEREARKYRHDFRHHNLLLLEYARQQNCDAIIRYLQEYETSAERKMERKLCENITVNSIVSAFARRAREQSISVKTDIRMRKETAIRDTDLVAILANVMENAVKGALMSEGEHWIELTIVHRGMKLIIQCKNSCARYVPFFNGLPQATGRTGIGVTSIVDAVASYAGDAEFSAQNGVFTSRILLNDGEELSN